jgi:hypothetical protein
MSYINWRSMRMNEPDKAELWREVAIGLIVALAGMVLLWAVGLAEVAWVAPFLVAVDGSVRRGRRRCARPAANAQ